MRDIINQHIVIIGAARSGLAAAKLLKRQGASVFVSDAGAITAPAKQELTAQGIAFEEYGHTDRAKEGAFAVVSPGVPTEASLVQWYLSNQKEVYSEVETASWFTNNRMVAITGSNGKTTVTSWVDHVWDTANVRHATAGNIGTAFSDVSDQDVGDYVLEVSSFQLDHIHDFQPSISMILNITPDHLDRYNQDFMAYAAAKFRITENQTSDNWFIYNYDDPVIQPHVEHLIKQESAPVCWAFSNQREVPQGAFVRDQHIIFKFNNTEEHLMPIQELALGGRHNLNNGLAVALAARAAEIKNDRIRESLQTFEGVEHRLERVRQVDGVRYINDSKATNVNAVWFALDSISVPLTLIMGGRDKGNDYAELMPLIKEKVHTIIALGESKDRIEEQLGQITLDFKRAETMGGAVRMAQKAARKGEVVLLSPACSSFDMFDNYEHRGHIFKEEVYKL
ncbi:MAG: UDP-N-acetylmuramoyl-L-alanine--D-glutamate ligase [Bacteroidota bacterium]